ncbi:PREDICTED: voltage-dependent calcium channel subunit alpha-2/delta-3-like [Rhagoletis zephyria]|uniref:voltage-dependent calcium channel subunit alpha-2/delta-3-like n=1 Tax=Rhagoletis zephyria TaxID=28612 RepID=UPI0008114C20|nr:PREDICTED: voltage-dependent calcium channel subunit alpha-2/delta-3-like [Rhagoletis zephyria]
MMEEMRIDLINMLNWKREAVERIANESEKLSDEHDYENDDIEYPNYYNMKKILSESDVTENLTLPEGENRLKLSAHPNFDNSLVNLENSAVHIPVNVYDNSSEVIHGIQVTEKLIDIFKLNLANDPTLSWQFLGSSKGFIRIYPASKWKTPIDSEGQSKTQIPDMYDCRTRQWYIQTAASPKDVVILMDVSGSMTGQRRTIALNVVNNILDTLTENDFFVVYNFTKEVKPVYPCFNHMVQATPRNVQEVKYMLDNFVTADIANFTAAFIDGFNILKEVFSEKKGALCNQAIMLITDGAPETYEPLFKEYNADKSVRIFTYVIGRDVTQIKEVNWMACNNKGFYAQVANLAEVREQVHQYIPVMSRPLVLSGARIFTWTPVYTAYSEIQLSDWIWDERVKALTVKLHEKKLIRGEESAIDVAVATADGSKSDLAQVTREDANNEDEFEIVDQDDTYLVCKRIFDAELEMAKKVVKKKIQLMTTVSTPVFDKRKYISRIANLLGVAGTDVPIKEIEKMAPPFKLGVNGYSFMTTNNGKVLFHPNFSPIFQDFTAIQDLVKPFYSAVDLTEVELGNITQESRTFDPNIVQIRTEMVNRKRGSKKVATRTFVDSMKRPLTRLQHYIYDSVENTPFSFAISLPEPYGSFRFTGQTDLRSSYNTENYTRYFTGTKWRIHPEWVYCENPQKLSIGPAPSTPEEALLQFLINELPKNQFRWRTSSSSPPSNANFTCNKELLQSLIFDAAATHIFDTCRDFELRHRRNTKGSVDVLNAFVSTRSGLTRFTNPCFSHDFRNRSEHEYNILARSIEEDYYKRAVDFYYLKNNAFIYSVPFNAYKNEEFLVTASRAIVVGNGKMSAPVAVIGLQYNHTQFRDAFFKITKEHNLNCLSDDTLNCFVLDNNGFIIISKGIKNGKEVNQTGMFFGDVNDDLLQDMVSQGVYRKMRFYDYQAICIEINNANSHSTSFLTPLHYIRQIGTWFASKLVRFYLSLAYDYLPVWLEEMVSMDYSDGESESPPPNPNKSHPRSCDKEIDLYDLINFSNQTLHFVHKCKTNELCSR